MKPRFFWQAFMMLGILLGLMSQVFAQQVTFAIPKLVVNTSFLNIRTGPGVQFSVLVTVVGGTELPVIGVANDQVWYQVSTTEGVGWVNIEFTLARGEFSRVPLVEAPELGDPIIGSPNANLGQGGGAVQGTSPVRYTGVSIEGGNLYAEPGSDKLVIYSAINREPNVILPLLNQTTINGEPWYQVNIPPFGVGWVNKVAFRPLACGTDTVGVTVGDTTLRFDGIAVRDSYPVPKGSEYFLNGFYFDQFFIVEDVNSTVGLIAVNDITPRTGVINACDLIPVQSATSNTVAALGQGGGGSLPTAPVVVAVAPSGNVAIVNTGNLNVRTGPAASYATLAVVPGGTSLGVVGVAEDNVWMLVQGKFGRGWINNEFILFRGVYSTVPILSQEEYPLLLVTNPIAALGQGGGGIAPTAALALGTQTRRFTGVTIEGGNLYAEPGSDKLVIYSAINREPNVILPLLNQTTINGEPWYQVNIPPFGIGWVNKVAFRPLACGTDNVGVTVGDTTLRFDGIAVRDSYPVPRGSEFFLEGFYFDQFFIVQDVHGTKGIIPVNDITPRTDVINACDLIPTGALEAAVAILGQGGGFAASITAVSGNIAVVNTGNLNIRSGPAASFGTVATVPGGTQLVVLARASDNVWFYIEGTFGRGWVNNEFVLFRGVYDSIPVIDN